jgi:predicted DNA-binding transcriptional regulator YafY
MRADRLLSIMLLLQVHQRVTSRELARRLEVSERTIHRDMDALSGAGIPVYAERGSSGGWALIEEYRTNLTGLSPTEIQALFLTRPARLLADLGLEKASNAALIKLRAALPSISRDTAEYARQRIYVDPTGWGQSVDSIEYLHIVQQAVWQERKLRFTYKSGDCDAVERLVDPLGLVAKGSVWYLVAAVDGDIRSYRVTRIHDAVVMDEPCARPEGFDLAAHWEQSTAAFKAHLPRYQATVRVAPDVFLRMRYAGRFARIEQVGEPEADGWRTVAMRFQFEAEAIEYVLSFGTQIEAIEPPGLRDKVIAAAESVLDYYRKRPSATIIARSDSGRS